MNQKLNSTENVASVILAAGRGSRMKDFNGNKTLLPLTPNGSPFKGSNLILIQIIQSLPPGPKAIVVNYNKQAVMDATTDFKPEYCLQPELNGTGGALLATRAFLKKQECSQFIITMGDVPLVRKETYITLIEKLKKTNMAVLGFCPEDKKEYGVLDIENRHVNKIIESKYWKNFSIERQLELKVCNSGIYAVRKNDLLKYLSILAEKPHIVDKKINGLIQPIKEYFITDLVEHMTNDGLTVGYVIAQNEQEVMGVDDINALRSAQKIFQGYTLQ